MDVKLSEEGVSINQKIDAKINVSPRALADMFWNMSEDHQAEFFNTLGVISHARMAIQLQYVTDNNCLDKNGRGFMQLVGDYSGKG